MKCLFVVMSLLICGNCFSADYMVTVDKKLSRSGTLEGLRAKAIADAKFVALKITPVYVERRINSTQEGLFESALASQVGMASVLDLKESSVTANGGVTIRYDITIAIDAEALKNFIEVADVTHRYNVALTRYKRWSKIFSDADRYIRIKVLSNRDDTYYWDGKTWRFLP